MDGDSDRCLMVIAQTLNDLVDTAVLNYCKKEDIEPDMEDVLKVRMMTIIIPDMKMDGLIEDDSQWIGSIRGSEARW